MREKDAHAVRDVAESSRARHKTIAPVEGKMVISSTPSNRKWSMKMRGTSHFSEGGNNSTSTRRHRNGS